MENVLFETSWLGESNVFRLNNAAYSQTLHMHAFLQNNVRFEAFHGGYHEKCRFPESDAVWLLSEPTFRIKVSPP
jgi:hypothetical protein